MSRYGVALGWDPGPVPDERPERATRPDKRFPSNRVIQLEEQLQFSWRKLVRAARASGDRDTLRAISEFHRDLTEWFDR